MGTNGNGRQGWKPGFGICTAWPYDAMNGIGLNHLTSAGLCPMVCNKRVRMSMTDAVLEFEMCDLLHMFFIVQLIEDLEPVRDRLSIGLLD
jgi:hypothetical protein